MHNHVRGINYQGVFRIYLLLLNVDNYETFVLQGEVSSKLKLLLITEQTLL